MFGYLECIILFTYFSANYAVCPPSQIGCSVLPLNLPQNFKCLGRKVTLSHHSHKLKFSVICIMT